MERIEILPLSALRESPFNPRKQFPEAALQELADSISGQGLLQPITVRPLRQAAGGEHVYEIVVGHRRTRATALAGMDSIRALIVDFTDEQAALAQLHENAKRQDISAMEEADAMAHLQREMGLSPAAIAQGAGKSLSSVYNALKLARVAPEVRHAVLNEQLPPQLAVEVARLAVSVQAAALKTLRDPHGAEGHGWVSYREAKRRLSSYLTPLLEGIFPLSDATLAVAGACEGCPKRAGNDPACTDLDPELCMDRSCFELKTTRHLERRAGDLREAGHEVITGDEAQRLMPYRSFVPFDMEALDHPAFEEGSVDVTWEQALGRLPKKAPQPKLVYVVNTTHGFLRGFIREGDTAAVLKALKKDPASLAGPGGNAHLFEDDADSNTGPAGSPDALADYTPEQRAVFNEHQRKGVIAAVLQAISNSPRTTDDMREVLRRERLLAEYFGPSIEAHFGIAEHQAAAQQEAKRADVEFEEHLWFEEWLAEQTADTLGAVITAIAALEVLGSAERPSRSQAERMVQLAQRYGVNVLDFAEVAP
jgi:ParB/RepB/Spo0J family partition protein